MHDDIDPAAEAAIAEVTGAGVPQWHTLSVGAARRLDDDLFGGGSAPPVADVFEFAIDGPECEIPIRCYRPSRTPAPTLVFYHGGGFVVGTLDSVDGISRRLCRRAPAVVLSVDYRLAPEHPFPAAIDDAHAALSWARETVDQVGGDPETLIVGGTSAGANLATGAARRAVREDGPAIERQLLAYPMIDPVGREDGTEGPLLCRADLDWFWETYLKSSVDRVNPYAAPLCATDHEGLPPATILTAGVDVLGPEGETYAKTLADDGVTVDHHHYPSLPHGFLSLAERVPAADDAMDTLAAAIRAER